MTRKIAVFPLYKENSAYFEIARNCMKTDNVELYDFGTLSDHTWKMKDLDAVFLNFYESLYADPPLADLKKFIKAMLKIITLLLLKANNVKIVYTIHNYKPHDNEANSLTGMVTNGIFSLSDMLIMLCHDTEKYLLSLKDGKKLLSKSIYIPHPEYSSVYRKDKRINFREELRIPGNAFVVLLVGLLRPYKNVEVWLKAAETISNNDIYFVLAGYAADKNYSRVIESKASSIKNVRFLNRFIENDEMYSLFQSADVLSLPYDKGSLNSGLVLAGLTFGVPIICPDIGSANDYSPEYFFKYDYEDPETHCKELTSAIEKAYYAKSNYPDAWNALKIKMINEVKENASVERLKEKYNKLYDILFEGQGR